MTKTFCRLENLLKKKNCLKLKVKQLLHYFNTLLFFEIITSVEKKPRVRPITFAGTFSELVKTLLLFILRQMLWTDGG